MSNIRVWVRGHLPEILLACVTFAIYLQTVTFDFLALDDELLILDNIKVHGISLANIWRIFTTYDPELYVPMTLLTYQIEYTFFGPNPAVFHATNLILHTANVLLVFAVFRRFLSVRTAFLCALLFAIHPLGVEAVAWASARKDVLSAFFFLLAFRGYLLYREKGRGYRSSIVCFILGLASKVSVFPLPFLLLLTDWMRGETIDRRRLRELAPYFLVAVIFIVIALFGKSAQVESPLVPLILAPAATFHYLGKFFLPVGLSIFYPFTDVVTLLHPRVLAGIFMCILISIAAGFSLRMTRKVLFAWLFFLALVAPSFANMLKGGADGVYDIYLASDRYAYLAILGPIFLLGALLRRSAVFAILPIAAAFSFLSFAQARTWASSEALFQNVIDQHQSSHVAYNNLAGVSVQNGEYAEAVKLYQRSLAIKKNSKAYFNLAQVYAASGDLENAFATYAELLVFQPRFARGHAAAGHLYLLHGNAQMAYVHLDLARTLAPDIASVRFDLGLLYERAAKPDLARKEYEAVLRLEPDHEKARLRLRRGEAGWSG